MLKTDIQFHRDVIFTTESTENTEIKPKPGEHELKIIGVLFPHLNG